jgi:hypothetical protein
MSLIRFSIKNFKGIVSFDAEPNGKSVTLRGANASGKSCCINALYWGLGGNLEGEVVNHGAEKAETEIRFDDYLITRKQKKGKRAELVVKSADGKASFNSPATLLAGFIGAIERRTFSSRPEKERQEIIRKLAPGLDVSDLEKEYARLYDERTGVNREAKMLHAQADGITVPGLPESPGDEIDIAAVAEKKAAAAKQKAENDKERSRLRQVMNQAILSKRSWDDAKSEVSKYENLLADAKRREEETMTDFRTAEHDAKKSEKAINEIVDPDTSTIDAEIAEAKTKNTAIRAAKESIATAQRAKKDKGIGEDHGPAGRNRKAEEGPRRVSRSPRGRFSSRSERSHVRG